MRPSQSAHTTNMLKPNMAALKGEWGKRILKTISDTPRVDLSKLSEKSKVLEERIMAAKQNGSY